MGKLSFTILAATISSLIWLGGENACYGYTIHPKADTLPPKKDSIVKKGFADIDISMSQKKDIANPTSCTDCHGALTEKKIKHTTATDKGCEDCHKTKDIPMAHQKGTIVLQNTLPNLCLSCHDKTKAIISASTNVHAPLNDTKSCSNCHSPHSSDEKNLLLSVKRALCLSCHSKSITVQKRTIANIGQLEKNAKSTHPPFKKCSSTCHNPHATSSDKLLSTFFTSNTYAVANPDSFALCWACHDAELMTAAKSSTATSFRNGDTNLHYVHVHGEKGRSCVLCHSPHAASNPSLIRESVGFGNWTFRMNFKSNDNGGSCAPGCHKEKTYTR